MQDLLDIIRSRQSTRAPYQAGRPLEREHLLQILEAMRWAPSAHNMQNFEVVVVDDPELISALAEIRGEISPVFLRENYEQLSQTEEELLTKKVGVLAKMFPPSWRTLDPSPDDGEERAAMLARALSSSAAFIVVLYDPARRAPASEGDFLGIISLGCVMQNMWLMAHSLGLGVHILSMFGSGSMAEEVKRLLAIPAHLRIAFAARIGFPFPPSGYLRVRRDLEMFVHHDRFGTRGV